MGKVKSSEMIVESKAKLPPAVAPLCFVGDLMRLPGGVELTKLIP